MGLSWVSWVLKNCELGFNWVSLLGFEKLRAGFSWVSWVLKKYELGLAGFQKIKVGFSWVFQVSTNN